jgi:MFS family permease
MTGFHTNVKLLMLRTFLISLYTGIYGIIFNLYVLNMGYHADFLGLLLAVNLLASSATSIPAGILCDRFNKKKLLMISGVLTLAVTIPLYITGSPYLMLALSALGGVFWSISAVAVTPLLAENSHADDNVHIFSTNASLGWIATILGCAMGGIIPTIWAAAFGLGSSYRMTLLTAVVLLAAGVALAALLKSNKKDHPISAISDRFTSPVKGIRAQGESFVRSLKDMRVSSDVLKFTVTSITFGIASGMIVPYFNVYFIRVMKVGVIEVGLASAIAGAVMIGGLMATPYLTSKIGKVRCAVLTKILSAPFLIFMALTTNFIMAAGAYVAYMFLINMAGPATTSFQMELIKPKEQGLAVVVMSTGSYVAISASTYVSGLLIAQGNYIVPFIATCVAYLATAALLYHYFKDCERPGFICQKKSTPLVSAEAIPLHAAECTIFHHGDANNT